MHGPWKRKCQSLAMPLRKLRGPTSQPRLLQRKHTLPRPRPPRMERNVRSTSSKPWALRCRAVTSRRRTLIQAECRFLPGCRLRLLAGTVSHLRPSRLKREKTPANSAWCHNRGASLLRHRLKSTRCLPSTRVKLLRRRCPRTLKGCWTWMPLPSRLPTWCRRPLSRSKVRRRWTWRWLPRRQTGRMPRTWLSRSSPPTRQAGRRRLTKPLR